MIKGILIDLGKTILTNEDFSFKRGLIAIYENFDFIKIDTNLESYLKKADEYMYLYHKRDITNIEIPFKKYISLVLKSFNITSYDEDLVEYTFLKHAMIDNLMPNVLDFLNYIKSINIPIIIVSNSSLSKKALSNELKSMNILHYFTDLISSSDILYRKPSKEIFDYAFDEIKKYIPNVNKSEIIYIGNDYKLDALGSFNAGLVSYFYNIENRKNISNNINVFYNYLDLINEIKKSLA